MSDSILRPCLPAAAQGAQRQGLQGSAAANGWQRTLGGAADPRPSTSQRLNPQIYLYSYFEISILILELTFVRSSSKLYSLLSLFLHIFHGHIVIMSWNLTKSEPPLHRAIPDYEP